MSTTVTQLSTTTAPSTQPETDGFGALSTGRGNLPLETLDVRLSTTGLAVRTELTQGFRNTYDEPLEATYVFPLPDRSAVTSLRMEADDRVIEGVLRERAEARADYDRALAEGKRASIAEEERPGVFTMRVGNILPGERVSVRLTLAGRLPYEDGAATLRVPLVVAPRYIPGRPLEGAGVGSGVEPDTDAVPDASRITPPVLLSGCPSPVALSIAVDIDPAGLPLAEVASSLHVVDVEEHAVGRLTAHIRPGERVDRDFVLRMRLGADDAVARSLVVVPDKDGGAEGTFALTLLPPALTAPARPRDVVFVLDRSGSMAGWKMVTARRATARIVDTLTAGDRFAVLAFDNKVETPPALPDGLVDATDRHRFRAVEHLAGLSARGGTEMLTPLLRAADLLGRTVDTPSDAPDRDRVLVLVTDGQVGNEDQILRELAPRLEGVRVHTVGIDVAVNESLLRRTAALGGGHYEIVESVDRLDAAMEAIHRRIGTPLLTDLAFGESGLEVIPETVTPTPLPALYAGAALVVTGRCRGSSHGKVTLSGRAADGADWTETVPSAVGDNHALAAVWARALLRDLEDRYVTLHAGRAPAGGDLGMLEERIVALSLRFGVLCRFTAYVAVDSCVVTDGGTPRQITQPVELPQGWEMAPAPPMAMAAMALPAHGKPARGFSQRRQSSKQPTGADLTSELAVLEAAAPADRPRLLVELAGRLEELIRRLEKTGTDPLLLRPLRDLLTDLQAYGRTDQPDVTETERLYLRALDVLRSFGRPRPARSGAFWRRST